MRSNFTMIRDSCGFHRNIQKLFETLMETRKFLTMQLDILCLAAGNSKTSKNTGNIGQFVTEIKFAISTHHRVNGINDIKCVHPPCERMTNNSRSDHGQ